MWSLHGLKLQQMQLKGYRYHRAVVTILGEVDKNK